MALDFKVTVICGNPEKDVEAKFQNLDEALGFYNQTSRYITDKNVDCVVELKNTSLNPNLLIAKTQRVKI